MTFIPVLPQQIDSTPVDAQTSNYSINSQESSALVYRSDLQSGFYVLMQPVGVRTTIKPDYQVQLLDRNYKSKLFHFLTDNFVFEDTNVESVHSWILYHKISLPVMESYLIEARKIMPVTENILSIVDSRLYMTFITSDDGSSFDTYIDSFLSSRESLKDKISVSIR